MSIIPASRLSRSDLHRLSNNIGIRRRPLSRQGNLQQRRIIAAMNRSLAGLGERVNYCDLSGRLVSAGGGGGF